MSPVPTPHELRWSALAPERFQELVTGLLPLVVAGHAAYTPSHALLPQDGALDGLIEGLFPELDPALRGRWAVFAYHPRDAPEASEKKCRDKLLKDLRSLKSPADYAVLVTSAMLDVAAQKRIAKLPRSARVKGAFVVERARLETWIRRIAPWILAEYLGEHWIGGLMTSAEVPDVASERPMRFVGREREVALLDDAVARIKDDAVARIKAEKPPSPTRRCLIVHAPGGFGKSRLMREWAQAFEVREGWPVRFHDSARPARDVIESELPRLVNREPIIVIDDAARDFDGQTEPWVTVLGRQTGLGALVLTTRSDELAALVRRVGEHGPILDQQLLPIGPLADEAGVTLLVEHGFDAARAQTYATMADGNLVLLDFLVQRGGAAIDFRDRTELIASVAESATRRVRDALGESVPSPLTMLAIIAAASPVFVIPNRFGKPHSLPLIAKLLGWSETDARVTLSRLARHGLFVGDGENEGYQLRSEVIANLVLAHAIDTFGPGWLTRLLTEAGDVRDVVLGNLGDLRYSSSARAMGHLETVARELLDSRTVDDSAYARRHALETLAPLGRLFPRHALAFVDALLVAEGTNSPWLTQQDVEPMVWALLSWPELMPEVLDLLVRMQRELPRTLMPWVTATPPIARIVNPYLIRYREPVIATIRGLAAWLETPTVDAARLAVLDDALDALLSPLFEVGLSTKAAPSEAWSDLRADAWRLVMRMVEHPDVEVRRRAPARFEALDDVRGLLPREHPIQRHAAELRGHLYAVLQRVLATESSLSVRARWEAVLLERWAYARDDADQCAEVLSRLSHTIEHLAFAAFEVRETAFDFSRFKELLVEPRQRHRAWVESYQGRRDAEIAAVLNGLRVDRLTTSSLISFLARLAEHHPVETERLAPAGWLARLCLARFDLLDAAYRSPETWREIPEPFAHQMESVWRRRAVDAPEVLRGRLPERLADARGLELRQLLEAHAARNHPEDLASMTEVLLALSGDGPPDDDERWSDFAWAIMWRLEPRQQLRVAATMLRHPKARSFAQSIWDRFFATEEQRAAFDGADRGELRQVLSQALCSRPSDLGDPGLRLLDWALEGSLEGWLRSIEGAINVQGAEALWTVGSLVDNEAPLFVGLVRTVEDVERVADAAILWSERLGPRGAASVARWVVRVAANNHDMFRQWLVRGTDARPTWIVAGILAALPAEGDAAFLFEWTRVMGAATTDKGVAEILETNLARPTNWSWGGSIGAEPPGPRASLTRLLALTDHMPASHEGRQFAKELGRRLGADMNEHAVHRQRRRTQR